MRERVLSGLLALGIVVMAAGVTDGIARPGTPISVPAGTTTITVDGATFVISTTSPVSCLLAFQGDALIEGSIQASTTAADVEVVWADTGLTIFAGRIVTQVPIRFVIPDEYLATQDTGHTEK